MARIVKYRIAGTVTFRIAGEVESKNPKMKPFVLPFTNSYTKHRAAMLNPEKQTL